MDTSMSPTEPLAITLHAAEWNLVMTALNEAPMPYRLTSVVIAKLSQQFQRRLADGPGNGAGSIADFRESLLKRPTA